MRNRDLELLSLARLIDKHSAEKLLDKCFKAVKAGNSEQDCQVLMTAHRSKGLQFDRVVLAEDYCTDLKDLEEVNILYVAITRAKRELMPNKMLQRLELDIQPQPERVIVKVSTETHSKCSQCGDRIVLCHGKLLAVRVDGCNTAMAAAEKSVCWKCATTADAAVTAMFDYQY